VTSLSGWQINHREKQLLILASTDETRRILEIRNPFFITACLKFNKQNKSDVWYHRLLNAGTAAHLLLAAFVLAFCAGVYFYVVPWMAEKAVDLIPRSVDDRIGSSYDENGVLGTEEKDSTLTVYVNRYLRAMAPELDSRYHLTVIRNDDMVNAFALPDGRLMIYTGILKKMNTHEELAGVLAHEVSHVEHRHSMRLMTRSLSGYLLLTLVLNDVNGLMTLLIDNAHNLQNLSYSRKFERQADLTGLALLQKHRIDPQGMVRLFELLSKEQEIEIPGWMSSHPVSKERIQYIREKITSSPYPVTRHPELQYLFNQIKKSTHE
jgi:Zn-dependent protease with chaperone function